MRRGGVMLLEALCALGGCGKPDGGTTAGVNVANTQPPGATAPGPVRTAMAPATPDRAADEAAIRAVIARVYRAADGGDNEAMWAELTARFAKPWRDCYALEAKLPEMEQVGACLDDAGSFIPGQDSDPGVPARTHHATIRWTGDDTAEATVSMRFFKRDTSDQSVRVAMVRDGDRWRIDDLWNDPTMKRGFRAEITEAAAGVRKTVQS